jgi:hypothetical protein
MSCSERSTERAIRMSRIAPHVFGPFAVHYCMLARALTLIAALN